MASLFVNDGEVIGLLEGFGRWGEVVAPVPEPPGGSRFRKVSDLDRVELGAGNTRLSPKEWFLPQGERLFRYSTAAGDPRAGILEEEPLEDVRRVLVGIRPCDARALKLLDLNFLADPYRDPWWERRREATCLVGIGCVDPCGTCFCLAVGTGPFDKGAVDVLMIPVQDGYVVEPVTKKGHDVVGRLGVGTPVGSHLMEKVQTVVKGAESKVGRPFDVKPLVDKPLIELFNAEFWQEMDFACINCGICTFLCPTCWCFDIQDEMTRDRGWRLRLWDSCMFPLFTLHGSGHNPRGEKFQRFRQRFMHKFKYFVDKYQEGPGCVGCGRCIQYCPVNIDIRRVVSHMTATCRCSV